MSLIEGSAFLSISRKKSDALLLAQPAIQKQD